MASFTEYIKKQIFAKHTAVLFFAALSLSFRYSYHPFLFYTLVCIRSKRKTI